MKKYVIDASVAVKWYSQYDEDDLIQADNLLRIYAEGVCELMAPTLIAYELANALRFNPNFGLEETVEAMQNFFALQIVLEDPSDSINAAVDLAYTYALTVYDAVYVALSQITATPLITADYKFYARAKELPFIEPLKDLKLQPNPDKPELKIEDLELGLVPGTEVDIVKEGNKYVLVINPIGEVKKKCDAVLTRDRGIYVKYFRVWPDMKAASISRYIKGLTRPLTSDPLLTHPPSSIFFLNS